MNPATRSTSTRASTTPPDPPSAMSPGDVQLAVAGLAHVISGVALLRDPGAFLQAVQPLITLIEDQTKLRSYSGNDQALVLVGVLSFAIGAQYLLSVYTMDEKAKRNSTRGHRLTKPSQTSASPAPGRLLFAATCFYVCKKTPDGSSLLALFGIFSFISGLLMGFTVGFGDGNAVDLEEQAKAEEARNREAREAARTLQQPSSSVEQSAAAPQSEKDE
ncbi:BQ2448_622 [Microbotryum intermedium]|uniref:BQ2448_622 protein n=1 Tax=Microbotryum intermedium TaxID=269621 RepID=A0A238F8S6_9BASI|nr:BQ2448_622 [Microbotryum intermedium]